MSKLTGMSSSGASKAELISTNDLFVLCPAGTCPVASHIMPSMRSTHCQSLHVYVCSSEAAGILRQTLQGPQQVQTVHKAPPSPQNNKPRVNCKVEPQDIEECMDTFLSVTEEFGHLFHQVWQVLHQQVTLILST